MRAWHTHDQYESSPVLVFQPLILVTILGWVGTNVFELWIKDFRKKDETAPSAHLQRRGPRSPYDVLEFNGSRFACLHCRLLLPHPRFDCVEKRTRRPETSKTIQGWRRADNRCPTSLIKLVWRKR